jgi:type I restriction enzyme S subunit
MSRSSRVALTELVRDLESGGRPKGGAHDSDFEVLSIGGEHLDGDGRFNFENKKFVSRAFYNSMHHGWLQRDDILVVKDGATTGKVAFLDESVPLPAAINEHVFRLSLNEKALAKYVFFYLVSPVGKAAILRDFRGATVGGISREFTECVLVPLPPLAEQKRITAILEKADRLRHLRRYGRELSDTFFQSVFLQMFGDPKCNEKQWKMLPWEDLVSISSGHGFKLAEYSTTGVRLLQIANVTFQEIDWSVMAFLPKTYLDTYPKLALRPGDLVMALNRPILGGKVKFAVLGFHDCPSILYQRVGKLTLKDSCVIQTFLCGFMLTRYFYLELQRRLFGSDQPYINPPELESLSMPVPPLQLQQKFAAIVRRFERLRAQQREAERQAEHLFQTLLDRVFNCDL